MFKKQFEILDFFHILYLLDYKHPHTEESCDFANFHYRKAFFKEKHPIKKKNFKHNTLNPNKIAVQTPSKITMPLIR